jgi:hypothetical protein
MKITLIFFFLAIVAIVAVKEEDFDFIEDVNNDEKINVALRR